MTLLDVLLHDVLPSELEGLLSDLYSHTVAPELGRLYADVLGVRFSDEVMKWASSRVPMRDTVAGYLVAGAAPLTLDGIQYVAAVDSTGFALVILVDRMLRRPASHVLRLAAMEPMFWERLLDSLDDPFVGSVLVRLVGSVDRSAIGLARGAIENLRCAPRAVQAHAVRESLLDHLHGLTEVAELRRWLVAAWGSSILDSDASLLRAAIADSLSSGPEQFSQTWVRAWRTLEAVGLSVPGSSPAVVDICSLLLSKSPTPWPAVVVDSWCTLLKAESHDILRQEVACVQALRFCFDHTKLPLGPIVAQAFFAVHDAAMHHNVDRPRWDLFGWTNWDKGAELRRRLVDAFSHGDWEPHWFVLAAGEPWLLRKLCKRMLRQWRGQAFLERALERLRVEPPNVLTVELADILRAPGYIVDWD
ncbi:MAG: hypothetical protein HOO96_39625 [Polyangiaceae bacterium]|nr:hypothetical protein [Polyangiaceae bacterium]